MIGTLINAAAIILGTVIGLLLRKGIPQRFQDTIGQGQGLCVILIGLSSAIKTADVTCVIICMVIGSLLGAWIDIELRLNTWVKPSSAGYPPMALRAVSPAASSLRRWCSAWARWPLSAPWTADCAGIIPR